MLAKGGGAEGIGLDNVRAGFEILGVNFLDHFRVSELEQLEIAFEMFRRMPGKALAAVLFFGKFAALDHGTHRAVEQGGHRSTSTDRGRHTCRRSIRA